MKILSLFSVILFFSLQLNAQVVGLPPFADVCENAGLIPLNTGTPSGGIYSGVGVSANNFNPSLAGVGTHAITYTYVDATGTYDTTQTITVNAAPNVSLSSFPLVCENDVFVNLNQGSPAGGTYIYGNAILFNSLFVVDSVGIGSHAVKYIVTNSFGCSDSSIANLVVNPAPNVNLIGFSGICDNQDTFDLVGGTPSGGIYIVNNADTVISFSPQLYGADSHLVTYIYTDGVGCSNSATENLIIFPNPDKPAVFPFSEDTLLSTVIGDSYEWFKNDSVVPVNARKLPVANQNGIFKVRVTANGCISEVSEPYKYGEPIGVHEPNQNKIKVYPTISSGIVYTSTDVKTPLNYQLFDVFGKLVQSGTLNPNQTISLEQLNKGFYFLAITSENLIEVTSIIRE